MREYASSSALNSASALTMPPSASHAASSGPSAPPEASAIPGQPPSTQVVQSVAESVASSGMM
jgi:hypothetical protein